MIVSLGVFHDADSDGEYDNLIDGLNGDLGNHQRGHLLPGDHTTKGERKEDDGVGQLTETVLSTARAEKFLPADESFMRLMI